MDPIPFALAAAVATALTAAVVALWRMVVVSNRRCEQSNAKLSAEISEARLAAVARSEREVMEARQQAERERDRALEIARILDDTKEVTRWAVETLRAMDTSRDAAHKLTALTQRKR